MFAEVLTKYTLAYEKLDDPADGTQIARLNLLNNNGIIPDLLMPPLHSLRKVGNKATHEAFGTVDSARTQLHLAHRVAVWLREAYGAGDVSIPDFVVPNEGKLSSERLPP